ncbi:hydroxyacid dehydrogenase [Candidatus Roizmanbacteria bacterium]|nr:MAG: hydroxyacid dehydrogenase [Candidatus Roizmanbacteria bacterium]
MDKRIVYFETEGWEREIIDGTFPQAELVSEQLTHENAKQYQDAQIVSSFIYSDLSKRVLEQLPQLECIATRSTGYDHIDLAYCKEHNITVCNVPEYGSNTVAEHTFALILNLTRKIYASVNQAKQLNFDHTQIRGIDVFGKTIGIIGLGKIGINVLRIAHGLKMKTLVYNRSQDPELQQRYGFEYVDIATLLSQSDIVTLHLPLVPETKHLINLDNIKTMKKGSYIINTARGGLIQTEALVQGLNEGILEELLSMSSKRKKSFQKRQRYYLPNSSRMPI